MVSKLSGYPKDHPLLKAITGYNRLVKTLCIFNYIGDDLVMTQELIANMLGVRMAGVTEAAGKPQKAGLIAFPQLAGSHHVKILIKD